jgi:ubiquinone/menaquinone biosynthesis C-methylase UbiE
MMSATRVQFTDASVPKVYDDLASRLSEPWSQRLLDEVKLQSGDLVLDIATGDGILARLAASRIGSDGHVFAIDLSKPVLDTARAQPAPESAARITYLQSSAAPLPGSSEIFDAVFCQQGLQFFPDRLAALREMRRILKPDGRVALAVWAPLERNPVFAAYHAALRASVSEELAGLMATPFGWSDGAELQSAVEEAGFREVRLSTPTISLVLEGGVEQVIRAFSAKTMSACAAALSQDARKALSARVRREMSALECDDRIVGEMVSHIVIAKP